MYPTDEELQNWRVSSEDHFVERKTYGDSKDWVKTVVGFANSAPHGRWGVLFIGVRNDGSVEDRRDLDAVQKTLDDKLRLVYPPIQYTTRVLDETGRPFLCVLVPESRQRPHFAGPAYIRAGSKTVIASDQQFARLIAERSSKGYLLGRHEGKAVRVSSSRSGRPALVVGRVIGWAHEEIVGCTAFSVTLRAAGGTTRAVNLERVEIVEDIASGEISLEIRQD
jgi:hypothetical protein